MSLADTQFTFYSPGVDSSSLPRTGRGRPVAPGGDPSVSRRSSSVKSPRPRGLGQVVSGSRDVAVRWSRRWYPVQKLAGREFDGQLPVLARVTRGYRCGPEPNASRLNDGQVTWLNKLEAIQRRSAICRM